MRRVIKFALFSLVVALVICFPRARHFRGHTDHVNGVVFAPDARHFISTSSFDHTLRIWDGTARAELAVLADEGEYLANVAFSPDSTMMVSGGKDKVVTVRKTSNGQIVCRLVGHTGDVRAVAFSPDGKSVASASADNTIRVWDLATTNVVLTLQRQDSCVGAVAFSPDGQALAVGGLCEDLQLWDLRSGKVRFSLPEKGIGVRLLFSPDGETLCSVHQTHLSLWDVATGQRRACESPDWLGDGEYIEALTFSPDGRTLAAGHEVGIGLWDVASGKITAKFPKDDSEHLLRFSDRFLLRPDRPELDPYIQAAAFRPNGDLMVLGTQICTTTVVMWRLTSVPVEK